MKLPFLTHRIVWVAIALVIYEALAIRTGRFETWTDACAHRSKKGSIIILYWFWLGAHLMSGGKV